MSQGAGTAGLAWVTWRQHRWALVITALAAAGACVWRLINQSRLQDLIDAGCIDGKTGGCQGDQLSRLYSYLYDSPFEEASLTGLAVVIAMFWAAPLIAREFEQRTYLVAWGQDVGPLRWLNTKAVIFAGSAIVLAVLINVAASAFDATRAQATLRPLNHFTGLRFEQTAPLQIAYVLFALGLGLAASALVRRTIVAVAISLVGYVGVRVLVAFYLRPRFMSPERIVYPNKQTFGPGSSATPDLGADVLNRRFGYLDPAGGEHDYSVMYSCSGVRPEYRGPDKPPPALADQQKYQDCVNGVAPNAFRDYQPGDRLATFRLIEMAIFLVLAAGLYLIAVRRVRVARARRLSTTS